RLLGLELSRLARRFLSRGSACQALAGVLRRAVRHGRGEQHLLPPAIAIRRCGLGGADLAGLRDRREGEPLSHPREATARDAAGRPTLLQRDQTACRVAEVRARPLAVAGELPAR